MFTRLALAATAASLGFTAVAHAAPEPATAVPGIYKLKTKRICVEAGLLQPNERAKIGGAQRPCLSKNAWSELGIDFVPPASPVQTAAS